MSEVLRDLVVSLSLNGDNFSRNLTSINKQIQEAESEFRRAASGVENFEKSVSGTRSQLSSLQQKLALQQKAVKQYERALEAANKKLENAYARNVVCLVAESQLTHGWSKSKLIPAFSQKIFCAPSFQNEAMLLSGRRWQLCERF